MTCACGHRAHDHMDRAFGHHCCPDSADRSSPVNRRCWCPGYRLPDSITLLRRNEWADYVRTALAEAFPWLRVPEVAG